MSQRTPHPQAIAQLLQSVQISEGGSTDGQSQALLNRPRYVQDEYQNHHHHRSPNFTPQHQTGSAVRESPRHPGFQVQLEQAHRAQGVSLMDYVKKPSQSQAPVDQATQSPALRQSDRLGNRSIPPPRSAAPSRPFAPTMAPPMHAFVAQCSYLDKVASVEIPQAMISSEELEEKKRFFTRLQGLCEQAILKQFPQLRNQFSLIQYGSLQSGFAVKGSDMDLMLSWSAPPSEAVSETVPRLLEKELLRAGHGARLLSRTRVPVLKICELPTEELLLALLEERQKWEEASTEEATPEVVQTSVNRDMSKEVGSNKTSHTEQDSERIDGPDGPHNQFRNRSRRHKKSSSGNVGKKEDAGAIKENSNGKPKGHAAKVSAAPNDKAKSERDPNELQNTRHPRVWFRERASGPLDFPNDGVGIQCDISFTRVLGMYNTQLLRCYGACDPRVRDMILFVKGWAKRRKINSGYYGTLSSYGWVLMALHFLINIARPPVLPNLQLEFGAAQQQKLVDGYNVNFADDEMQLTQLAAVGRLTQNSEPVGSLMRGFFHYYAQQGRHVVSGGFNWRDYIISIRTPGGVLYKRDKGWTGATTVMMNDIEVKQRYLLAIECPFEIDHNVARTVHHNGVVAIRDEFRRAWRILETEVGMGHNPHEALFAEVVEKRQPPNTTSRKDEPPIGPLAAEDVQPGK